MKAMMEWPVPRTVKQLRGFLGLTGYYRRFVRGYGVLVKPLTDLLKREKFEWSALVGSAFEKLKTKMSTIPVLALPDFTKEFVVETDACLKGIGVVLMQDNHPLAYISKALSQQHLNLSVYEKEMLAIVKAIDK